MTKRFGLLLVAVAFGVAALATMETHAQEKGKSKIKEKKVGDAVLKYEDLKEGTGDEARRGDVVVVHYTGMFKDGKKFDSSVGKDPLEFKLGAPGLIKGFDAGVTGMKKGGKRKLMIPSALGYGKAGRGPIPPDTDLIFEVELVKIK